MTHLHARASGANSPDQPAAPERDWLAGLAAESRWLLDQTKVSGAKVDKGPKSAESLVRDQLLAEIVRRYGQGKKVAVERWGWKRVDGTIRRCSRVR